MDTIWWGDGESIDKSLIKGTVEKKYVVVDKKENLILYKLKS